MAMTIEEKAIKTLNEIIDEGWLISDMEKCTAIDACEFAIDRILKCQKIQEIMNADLEHIHPLDRDKYIVASIKEVLEDDKG